MSAAFAPSWPGSRVLLRWWRELAGRKPQQLRISRLLFHHIEALVRVHRSRILDRWQLALLRVAGARVPCGGELISALTDLQIEAQVLVQLVRELTDAGLLHRNGAGVWQMTPAGRDALATGALPVFDEERRTFAFVDHSALGRPPHFLPLKRLYPLASGPSPEAAGCSFDVAYLEMCLRQTPQWKARYRFPTDVETLLPPAANWRRVILDAVESRTLVFIHTTDASAAPLLLGFAIQPEDWTLKPEPLLALADGWEEALPDLAVEPSLEAWRRVWKEWSHPRGLPPAEVEACRLERADHRLLVHAPPRLIERLRAARSDAVKQEAWLLGGDDRTRLAALIELHPL